jgi:Tol biopolymer transport system component
MDRNGRQTGTLGEVGGYFDPMFSRDGSRLALEKHDPGRGSGDIWTVDLARAAFTRLTTAPGYETTPVWSPDGRVAYASDQATTPHIFVNSATAAGAESLLIDTQSRSTGRRTAATSSTWSTAAPRAKTSGSTTRHRRRWRR